RTFLKSSHFIFLLKFGFRQFETFICLLRFVEFYYRYIKILRKLFFDELQKSKVLEKNAYSWKVFPK
ncbi:hypothetical protein ACYB1V_25260, partial [Klebsiella pneumoniae]